MFRKKHYAFLIFIVALLFISSIAAYAEDIQWRPINDVPGARILSLALDPNNPQVLYAGLPFGGGVWRSTDGAESWSSCGNHSLPEKADITSLIVDPKDPNHLLATNSRGSEYGLWETTDAGLNWSQIQQGVWGHLIYHPGGNILYAVSDGTVRKSTDGGTTWTTILSGSINALTMHPGDSQTLYATSANYVYWTNDGGTTWVNYARNFGYYSPTLAVHPTSSVLYAGVINEYVSESHDHGATWSRFKYGDDNSPQTLALAGIGYNTLIVMSSRHHEFWGDRPSGTLASPIEPASMRTWDQVSNAVAVWKGSAAVAVDSSNSNIVYLGSTAGVIKSTDGGTSFELKATGLRGLAPEFMVDPYDGMLYAADAGYGGLFHSTDGGVSWARDVEGMWFGPWTNTQPMAFGPDRIYAANNGNAYLYWIYSRPRSGSTWTPGEGLWRRYAGEGAYVGIVADTCNPGHVYAAHAGPGYYNWDTDHYIPYSTDGGQTWSEFAFPGVDGWPSDKPRISSIALEYDQVSGCTLYVALSNPVRLMRRMLGQTSSQWEQVSLTGVDTSSNISRILIPLQGNIYLIDGYRLYHSSDGGTSWVEVTGNALPQSYLADSTALAFSPTDPLRAYVRARSSYNVPGLIYTTIDGGASWVEVTREGLSDDSLRELRHFAVDFHDPNTLYASSRQPGGSSNFGIPPASGWKITIPLDTVQDTTPPVLPTLSDITVEAANSSGAAVTYAVPVATDNVDPSPVVNCTPISDSTFGIGTTVVTCTATDSSGNSSIVTFNVTVQDTTAPVVTAPGDITIEATGSTTSVTLGSGTATDLVDGVLIPIPDKTGPFGVGIHTVVWSATDGTGNSGTATQTVTVTDTTAPVVTAPANITVEATGTLTSVILGTGSATDLVDGMLTPAPNQIVPFASGVHTVVWSATDSSGNTGTATQTVTVTDTTAPVITVPADITAEATGAQTSVSIGTATATDLVDGTVAVYNNAPITFPVGTTVVTWTASDSSGNTATATQNVTITDNTAPAVVAPGDITVEATGPTTPVTLGSGTATDLVDGVLTPTPDQTGPFSVGVHTIVWSATDSSGNIGTATQMVTVTDSAAPVFPILDAISAEATSAAGAVVNYEVIANDIVDPFPSIICNPASGNTFAIGGTTVSCTATDFSGNSSIANFVVTVTASDIDGDGVPDVLDPCPGDAYNACNPDSSGAAIIDATSGGIVSTTDGTLVMTIPPNALSQDTTVSITETGAGGATFELTTNLGEAIGVYGLEILPAGTTFAAPVTLVFAWKDVDNDGTVDGTQIKEENLRITKDGVAITEKCKFDLGCDPVVNTFTIQVTSLSVFVLTFIDDEGPAVTIVMATPNPAEAGTPITLVATLDDTLTGGSNIDSAEYNVDNGSYLPMTAQNGVFDSVAEQVMAALPAFASVGDHSLCVRGMDQFRNVVGPKKCIVLSVVDTTAPAVTAPLDITIEAIGPMTPVTLGTGTATDFVDGMLTPTPDQTGPFSVGVHTIFWSVMDSSGNTGTATQTVTVTDKTPPVVSAPASIIIEASGTTTPVVLGTGTATDLVDGILAPTPDQTGPFAVGIYTITWSATDASGNTGTATQPVIVTDTTPPVITVPSDILVEATSPSGAVVNYPDPSVIDIADPFPSVVCNPASGSTFPLGTTTVNCNASDAFGNNSDGSFMVTVVSPIEVTNVSLDILPQGATNQNVTITGDNFEAGAAVSFSGSGISVNTVTFMNSNQLIVNISIDPTAPEGFRDVVVRNTNGLSGTGVGLLRIVTQSGAISDMSNDVSDFLTSGEINNSGIANSLLASLNNANKTLDRNATSATNGILNALINKLDAYLKGNKISSSVKASLEIKINALISSL